MVKNKNVRRISVDPQLVLESQHFVVIGEYVVAVILGYMGVTVALTLGWDEFLLGSRGVPLILVMLLIKLVLAPLLEPVHLLQKHGVLVVLIYDGCWLPDSQLLWDVQEANESDA